jgi:Lipopolysaccharide-assembly, LptC-related
MFTQARLRHLLCTRSRQLGIGLCILSATVHAKEPAVVKPTPPASAAAGEPTGMAAVAKMLPLGFINRQVHMPAFDAAGQPSSEMNANTLTRIDDEHLRAEQVRIHMHGKTAAEETHIQLPSAIYHLPEQTVRSGQRCTISRPTFQMSGDSLIFDTRSSTGSFSGRVRTYIYQQQSSQPSAQK